ncbi:MAG TPA: extracellular solute-binding protein [Thermoanaerobaculia bacterium]|nr:extracellular solute-binding protein [Thermoanaerobaculia bacterium]
MCAVLGTLVGAALLIACGHDQRTPLVLYSPHGRDLLVLFEQTYERAHPEVDVRWLDMGSQEVYDRVRAEAANPQADVWFGGPDTIFARGAAEGLLAPHRPPWADALSPDCRAAGDLYFCLYLTAPVLVYNRDAVPAAEAPADWDDLLAPRWKGKVIIRDPLASGTMRTLFGMVLAQSVTDTGNAERGFQWLRRLDGQTKEYVQNPALLFTKLTRREGLVTVWELTDMFWQQRRGVPIAYNFPTSGTPVIADAVGLVAHARHPEQAAAFVDWLGTLEAQRLAADKAYRLPARTDLPREQLPEWAQRVLAQMKPAHYDRALVAAHGAEWMEHWDREVRSKGGSA